MAFCAMPASPFQGWLQVALLLLSSWSLSAAKVEITSPSLTFPTDMKAIEADWHTAGPVEMSKKKDSLLMNPAVVDWPTLIWSRERIPSDNFEVTIVVSALFPNEEANTMFDLNGVGFWYCYEGPEGTVAVTARNEKRRHKKKPKGDKGRFGNFGYKDDFDGLGGFLFFDAGSPMMTLLTNTPPEKKMSHDATGADEGLGLYEAFFGKARKGEIKIKMRIEPTKASVNINGELIEVEGSFRAGGHFGMTALSSSYEKDKSLVPTLVEIKDLKIMSFVPLVELPEVAPHSEPRSLEQEPGVVEKKPSTSEAPGAEDSAESEVDELPSYDEVSHKVATTPTVQSGLHRELGALKKQVQDNSAKLAALLQEVEALKKAEL